LSRLLAIWRPTGKRIVLRVLRNNPARRLYERLGFSVFAEEEFTFRMKCQAHANVGGHPLG